MKTETRDPINELRPLPFVKAMPRWGEKSDQFNGFKDDIRANGIQHPLLITKDNKVVDGETRRLAAVDLQFHEVPVQVVSDDEVQEIIVRELVRRRNMSKGQLAYIICPMLENAFMESLRRRSQNASKTKPTQLDSFSDVKEWSNLLGFSDELLRQARELHKIFYKHPALKEEWEPKILDMEKPVSIGAALAGIGGAGADQGKRDQGVAAAQMEFWNAPFDGLKNALPAWTKMDDQRKQLVITEWRKTARKLPQDLRDGMREVLDELEGGK